MKNEKYKSKKRDRPGTVLFTFNFTFLILHCF